MNSLKLLFAIFLFLSVTPVSVTADSDITAGDSTSAAVFDTLESSLTVLPAVFYMPETKLGFGVYPNYIFRFSPHCRPSNLSFLAFYTVKKQISISFDPNLYFRDNRYILSGTVFYEKWPNGFFGFGTGVSKEDEEEFTTRNTGFAIGIKRRVAKELYAGLLYGLTNVKFLEIEENGALAQGDITGSENGTNSGAGFSISWEGRDNTFFPGEGEYLELESSFYGRTIGGDYTYRRLTIDLRKYHSFYSDNVLAFQLYGDFISGDAPFGNYSRVGQIVRGYLPMLYIEKKLVAAQLEYRRVPLLGRFGFTLFAGAGSVVRTISDFRSSKFKFAAGFGFRYILVESEKFNIRLDYGIGHDSAELYLAVGEAF
ncbi:MAG: BamA/TamA family outer membrane protein [Candidatus Zixiibacteriota bacterium]|nr:MAG: BamA/TamA family outer membrane protein [candidate division Zixibacteria bacterium]